VSAIVTTAAELSEKSFATWKVALVWVLVIVQEAAPPFVIATLVQFELAV
jgi:hypothetical protein